MNPLNDDQLVALLDDLESDRVERKSTWSASAADKVREAVCAPDEAAGAIGTGIGEATVGTIRLPVLGVHRRFSAPKTLRALSP